MQKMLVTFAAAASLGLVATAAQAATLDDVKAKDYIQCGVTGGVAGFSAPDANNVWAGLEVDFCRAVAAAVFNDAGKVRYTPLTSQERFAALSAGEIDILSRTTTWTMSRDTDLGISFIGTMYYDGQGFMVRKADEIASALDLSGAAICIESGTTTELNAADYFACGCRTADCTGRWPVTPLDADRDPARPYLCLRSQDYLLGKVRHVVQIDLDSPALGFEEPQSATAERKPGRS